MTEQEIQEQVFELVADKLSVEPSQITMEANFTTDLGADSLDTVELMMAFENQFDMTIPDEDARSIKTVGDAVEYIKNHAK